MKALFFMGGPLFMSILSVLLIAAVGCIAYYFMLGFRSQEVAVRSFIQKMKYGKSIALLALIVGILGQLIGFYSAFSVMEQVQEISPQIVYSGIKVSMVTTLYGLLIYLFSLSIWFIGSMILENRIKT